jgi:hypothetical protein
MTTGALVDGVRAVSTPPPDAVSGTPLAFSRPQASDATTAASVAYLAIIRASQRLPWISHASL